MIIIAVGSKLPVIVSGNPSLILGSKDKEQVCFFFINTFNNSSVFVCHANGRLKIIKNVLIRR